MDAREESADHHKGGKGDEGGGEERGERFVCYTSFQFYDRARHNARYEQRRRRGIRRLEGSVYQYRAVIHDRLFKKEEYGTHDDVIGSEYEDADVYSSDAAPFDQLDKSKECKAHNDCEWYDAESVCQLVQCHIYACETMKSAVES